MYFRAHLTFNRRNRGAHAPGVIGGGHTGGTLPRPTGVTRLKVKPMAGATRIAFEEIGYCELNGKTYRVLEVGEDWIDVRPARTDLESPAARSDTTSR